MRLVVDVELDAPESAVVPWVESLHAYPEWTGLVHRVAIDPGATDCWEVELRARIGPLARSKRLRMQRSGDSGTAVREFRFARVERDGRQHSVWELTATVEPIGAVDAPRTRLVMTLFYGGANWAGGLVERALHDEIEQSRQRLAGLVSEGRLPGPTR